MEVLYRAYRPKAFGDVIGQEHIKITLQQAVAGGSFAHAYLFTGPRGTGKTSIARILARAINCLQPKNGEPCNKCEICKQFLAGTSLDLLEIDAASNTGVENIREITEHLKFTPTHAKYKVFIIDEVHMLSKGAFNALLKTLEEPPAHAVFILATTEIHKVPATVISRTQRFDFRKIDNKILLEHLSALAKKEKINIDQASLELVVNAAEGSVRDALSILDKLATFDKVDLARAEELLGITNVSAAQKFLDILAEKNAKGALNFLQGLFDAGIDPVQFNKDFLEYLRKVMMIAMGADLQFALDQSQAENLKRHSAAIAPAQLLYIIRLFLRANKDFAISPNVELPVEIAAAEACLSSSSSSSASVSAAPVIEVKKKSEVVADPAKEQVRESEKPKKLVSKQELQDAWADILKEIKTSASSMFVLLQQAQLRDCVENNIVLVFNHKFHKDAMDSVKNKMAILNFFNTKFDTEFSLTSILEQNIIKESAEDATALAFDVFGDEIL